MDAFRIEIPLFIEPTVHVWRIPCCGNSLIERALFLHNRQGYTVRVRSLQCFILLLEPNLLTPPCYIEYHIGVYQQPFQQHQGTSVRKRVSIVSAFSTDADNICVPIPRQSVFQLALPYP